MKVLSPYELSMKMKEESEGDPNYARSVAEPWNFVRDPNNIKLCGNLVVPSYVHGYSLAIEYMTKWFQRTFEDNNYFKSVFIDGKHVIDDYRKFDKMIVKGENPRLRIEPRVQVDYDMETVDLYQAPAWVFLRRTNAQDSFFKDHQNNLFLNMQARAIQMDFNFKARVNTRAQQLDLMHKMELYFRVGATQAEEVSVDWHVPKELMLHIANKAGFKIKDGMILDIIEFLQYLNRNSDVPFLFKLRAINKKPEFFVRISNLYTHIMIADKLQIDDGERDGKLDFNFHVEMNARLRMPIPHFYTLYSITDDIKDIRLTKEDIGSVAIHSINLIEYPKTNERGWPQAAITDYLTDKGDQEIDISTMFTGDNILAKTINHDLLLGVNPSHFIQIVIYQEEDLARIVPFSVDWSKMLVTLDEPVAKDYLLHLVLYYDRNYVSELEINLNDYYDNRTLPNEEKDKTYRTHEVDKRH